MTLGAFEYNMHLKSSAEALNRLQTLRNARRKLEESGMLPDDVVLTDFSKLIKIEEENLQRINDMIKETEDCDNGRLQRLKDKLAEKERGLLSLKKKLEEIDQNIDDIQTNNPIIEEWHTLWSERVGIVTAKEHIENEIEELEEELEGERSTLEEKYEISG